MKFAAAAFPFIYALLQIDHIKGKRGKWGTVFLEIRLNFAINHRNNTHICLVFILCHIFCCLLQYWLSLKKECFKMTIAMCNEKRDSYA